MPALRRSVVRFNFDWTTLSPTSTNRTDEMRGIIAPVAGLTACALMFAPPPAAAQGLHLEGHVGAALPTGQLGGADTFTGLSFGVSGAATTSTGLGAYLGYQHAGHGVQNRQFINGVQRWWSTHVSSELLRAGARYSRPVAPGGVEAFGQLGAVAARLRHRSEISETGVPPRTEVSRSEPGIGLELGGGAAFRLTPSFEIAPEIRWTVYRLRYDEDEEVPERLTGDGTASFVTFGASIRFHP